MTLHTGNWVSAHWLPQGSTACVQTPLVQGPVVPGQSTSVQQSWQVLLPTGHSLRLPHMPGTALHVWSPLTSQVSPGLVQLLSFRQPQQDVPSGEGNGCVASAHPSHWKPLTGWQRWTPLSVVPQLKLVESAQGVVSEHSGAQAPVADPVFLKQRRPVSQSKSYVQ